MDSNLLILIVVLVLLFGGGGFYWSRRGNGDCRSSVSGTPFVDCSGPGLQSGEFSGRNRTEPAIPGAPMKPRPMSGRRCAGTIHKETR